MADHPTASWQAMQNGNVFYRQQRLYTLDGKLPSLGDCIVAGCRNGGPLALMRDSTKIIAIGSATSTFAKSQIQVYSPSGEGLLLFGWDQAKIIRFGWTGDERLVVLNEEGVYRLYDLQGDYTQFSLGTDAGEVGITDARIHENGLVALTGSLQLLEVKGWEGGKSLTLANPNLSQPPAVWTLIPPDLTISRHVEVLLSVEASIVSVDNLEAVDQRLSRGPFTHLAPSPNGKSLALLTVTGLLWVVSTDFQRGLAEFDTTSVAGAEGLVRQVEWCGNDAILVTWDALVLLVGPFGDTLQYFYAGPTFAVTEVDGVRVIGPDTSDFIQKVPASSVSVFRPGSASPSAILFDAWENFNNRSPKADENIRSIKPDLAAAVDEVIDAAGQEWEPTWQRRLLSVRRKLGKSFLDLYNSTDFVNMGKTLKVLNAVRQFEVGIPITHFQYNYLSPTHLISRLTSRNLHLLALHISYFLSLSPDDVLKHWASAKITKSKPISSGTANDTDMTGDEEVSRAIVEKFEKLGGASVSYAEIAKKAWEVGRTRLATMLLDHEPRASDQVPLLLMMKEDRLALQKAVDSGDTDLVYHVLLQLYNRLPLGVFFRLIEDGGSSLAPASRLLQVYAREQNPEMLRDFYYSDDRRVESAVLCLEEARRMKATKVTSIKAAQKFFSEDKERSFEAKMMDEYSRLLAIQQTLEKETTDKIEFFGLSIDETIKKCLLMACPNALTSSSRNSKFWYLKLHALTATRDFEGLETFSRSKRSPIGYEAFVRHLVEKGHAKEAVSYVQRCDAHKRIDLYVECGEWVMAGKECKERGDRARLECLDQIASTMK
ncbi:vacuolar assembling/sorting protein VPS16 [Multifurca ochricompacta]|uniref:Probable vacuolar protein sorting-associated protein 16 homolog n=1 Tax=Multifurca ochricompacta TaxID=376703 RepID=A0AAD4M1I2_9AGAM|nr:vacuolar assembling/sorting protein VPS16 [Multifurca ochricompacta]